MSGGDDTTGMELAVIGMAGRFPGAPDVAAFWRNLRAGVESISFFSVDDARAAGVPESLLSNPDYVRAFGVLEGAEDFDARFFGYNPREAETLDPQQRLFLECAWEALEDGGYDPSRYARPVGVFAGAGMNLYLLLHLWNGQVPEDPAEAHQLSLGNEKDYLASRVAYKLNLRGPALSVQTACSTSLVAIHLACQSLLNGECDMALAGGVGLSLPQKSGYLFQPEGIQSPDGHCRAFDANAAGTVGGNGLGVVVLKRLQDAQEDGDRILAVVKGSAVNNDGSGKMGFTAPGVEGQAEVIRAALSVAEVPAESVSFIEAHGTGTALGDPVEFKALVRAYGAGPAGRCALGSAKTNIGHLDAAAGVAGFIKAVLALQHRELPPTLHFEQPNPRIDFEHSPFYVNRELQPWAAKGVRRAAVSSLGIGGTNAHVVLEEAPALEAGSPARPSDVVVLSARSPEALEAATDRLVAHLEAHPSLPFADVCHTLQVGRRAFAYRRAVSGRSAGDVLSALKARDAARVMEGHVVEEGRPVFFLFPGQGTQRPGMARELYENVPEFRRRIDEGAALLRPHLRGLDLRTVLYPEPGMEDAAERLQETWLAQPALFLVEYALARQWQAWGVQPGGMLGHSIGEFVAACVAGVLSFEDALAVVAARGRLMQDLPRGAMLAVELPAEQLRPLLGDALSLAASNAPAMSVASGETEALGALEARLLARGVGCKRLRTSHAFHSAMMEPALAAFAERLRRVRLQAPSIPYVSNVTGTWITEAEATDPEYYARHLRQGVRFSEGLQTLLRERPLLLEVGPGRGLGALARMQPDFDAKRPPVATLPREDEAKSGAGLLEPLGRLWLAGAVIDWRAYREGERRLRVALPTYPFERERCWIERGASAPEPRGPRSVEGLYLPTWREAPAPESDAVRAQAPIVLLAAQDGPGARVAEHLERRGARLIRVFPGAHFERRDASTYRLRPDSAEDHRALWDALAGTGFGTVVHALGLAGGARTLAFPGLLHLAQAARGRGLHVDVLAERLHAVTADEPVEPAVATALGFARVLPLEQPGVSCRTLDVAPEAWRGVRAESSAARVATEVLAVPTHRAVAFRGAQRWVEDFQPVSAEGGGLLPEGGTHVVMGPLTGPLLSFAEALAARPGAKLVVAGPANASAVGALEARGASVIRLETGSGAGAVRAALREARERFGPVQGLVLDPIAGAAPEPLALESLSRAGGSVSAGAGHPSPGGEGDGALPGLAFLRELAAVVRDEPPRHCWLQASLATAVGALGQAVTVAKAAFVEALAHELNRHGETSCTVVAWDLWEEVDGPSRRATGPRPLTHAEGVRASERILRAGAPSRILVATEPPGERLRAQAGSNPLVPLDAEAARHERPRLTTPYRDAENETEQRILELWQELLGVERIGADDDFFELGGHSLLATRIAARLKALFGVEVSLRALYDAPTAARLALVIEELILDELERADGNPREGEVQDT
ncbi:acyltransferase domain-containing protein [Corallococcus exercitus]|uniref:type I polyketide synthase n=1 Tax=Corallococcus exercitus TaxID=2316736 RepID=UPI000EA07E8A|nr:type I polyketide synthase [Corallococcus exercitus]RKG71007.1 acyltransferase domain-containing protein [Corallococcus exercitus]